MIVHGLFSSWAAMVIKLLRRCTHFNVHFIILYSADKRTFESERTFHQSHLRSPKWKASRILTSNWVKSCLFPEEERPLPPEFQNTFIRVSSTFDLIFSTHHTDYAVTGLVPICIFNIFTMRNCWSGSKRG